MNTRQCGIIVGSMLGVVLLWGVASADVTVPTPEFLASALRNQETLCGQSLEVIYEATIDKVNKTKFYGGTYIRTPGVLFSEETVFSDGQPGYTVKASYNRETGEYRKLVTANKKPATGKVSKGLDQPFSMQSFIETSGFKLHDGVLYDVITKGTVARAEELIDGHLCWRVTVPSTKRAIKEYVVWLDRSIGYCPRQISINWYEQANPEIISFRDYRETKPGVWLPYEHVVEHDRSDGPLWLSTRVVSANAGGTVPSDELAVSFPSGTTVLKGGVTYVEP